MIKITGAHFPCYGVKGNTHNVYKFHATDTENNFDFLYCADTWKYKNAEADFKRRVAVVFERAA